MPRRAREPGSPFGRWLRQQLRRREMSQADLARRIGIQNSTVSKWVHDGHPEPENCERIAEALLIPVEEVMRAAGYLPGERLPRDRMLRELTGAVQALPDPLIPVVHAMVHGLLGQRNTVLEEVRVRLGISPAGDRPEREDRATQ